MSTPTFGLTPDNILEAYPGTIIQDFTWGSSCGEEVIEREITLQAAKLWTLLPPAVRNRSTIIRFLRITPDEDGLFTLPFPPEAPNDLVVFADNDPQGKCAAPCDLDKYWRCAERLPVTFLPATPDPYDPYAPPAVDRWQVGPGTGPILVSYRLARDAALPSLQTLLRDMVACALGRRLYSAAEDSDWSLVAYYCDSAKEMLDAIDRHWVPAELADLPLAFRDALIASYRLVRSD